MNTTNNVNGFGGGFPTIIQYGDTQNIYFKMVSSTDHYTPVTSGTPTVRIIKNENGGVYETPEGNVLAVGAGVYMFDPTVNDYDTAGTFWFHATLTGADNYDQMFIIQETDSLSQTGFDQFGTADPHANDMTLAFGGRVPNTYTRPLDYPWDKDVSLGP